VEVFVYRVRPGGADVIALTASGIRVEIPQAGTARDFSVDERGGLVYQRLEGRRGRVARAGGAAAPEALELKEGAARAPVAWPAGRVTLSATRRILALSADRRRAAALERPPGGFPMPLVLDDGGAVRAVPWPAGRRVTIAGFVP
jgi:hypothetical protein